MDRISEIKRAHKLLKKRGRPRVLHRLTEEEKADKMVARRARRTQLVMIRYNLRKSKGLCIKCGKEAVKVKYEYKGVSLITKSAIFCITHWKDEEVKKEMLKAL